MSNSFGSRLRQLRSRLDWSAEQIGTLFDRTRATIYLWENDSSAPSSTVRSLVESIHRELDRWEEECSAKELSERKRMLREEGLDGYLRHLEETHDTGGSDYEQLVRRLQSRGGLVLEREGDSLPRVYLIPVDELNDYGIEEF